MNTDIFHTINDWAGKYSVLDAIMIFCAVYLIYILFVIAAICMVYLASKKQWRDLLMISLTLGIAFGVLLLLSAIFTSDRPFVNHASNQLIPHIANQSFPSDHATGSMTVALAILFFTRFKRTGWVLVAFAVAIGVSRIFVGVHYPLDVIGGILTALFGVAVALVLNKALPKRQAEHSESNQS